VKKTRWERR